MTALRIPQVHGLRLGPLGHLSACLVSVAAAMLAQDWHVAAVCLVVLLITAVFCPVGLDPLRRIWLWFFVLFLVIPSTLLGDGGGWTVMGVSISSDGLVTGVQMALRAVTVLIAVTSFSAALSVSQLASLLERVGFKGLGFAVGVAMNMLPTVQEMATTSFHALRLRGGLRRRRLKTLRLLLITIVVNSLVHADDIVSAAQARAFSLERTRPTHWEWGIGDAVFATALCALMAAMLWG